MPSIVVYSERQSPRLKYVLDWLLTETLHLSYSLASNEQEVMDLPFFISYGRHFSNALSIPDCGLLWETGIIKQEIQVAEWNKVPAFFPGGGHSLPVDIFSSVFFLITRYEEYYEFLPDKYGRYPPEESILTKYSLLIRPIVDEWILMLHQSLIKNTVSSKLDPFQYIPTYDIDIAWSYKHKSPARIAGAFSRDLLKRDFVSVRNRLNVLFGKAPDPYDCFDWLFQIHKELGLTPYYFVLSALKKTAFDKNISPLHPEMSSLIGAIAAAGKIGLHPSFFSNDEEIFLKEKKTLEHISSHTVRHSRQHYIKLRLPETYQQLQQRGITDDWSMGYGSRLGFRAGTGRAFFWYDLRKEQQTNLRVHPFCFMDSTAHFEEGLSVEEAFKKLNGMKEMEERTSGRLITVFHNFSLGSDPQWKGWNNAYYRFLKSVSET